MTAPTNQPWALNTLSSIPIEVPGKGIQYYANKAQPPTEVSNSGILAGAAVPIQWINFQFDSIYKSIDYLYNYPENKVIVDSTTARTFSLGDIAAYIRFTSSSAVSYIINGGVAPIGAKIKIRQGGSGVVTVAGGTGVVNFNKPSGKASKTSGAESTITLIKISQSGSTDVWDCYGDLGT